jgi:hypothetical protein
MAVRLLGVAVELAAEDVEVGGAAAEHAEHFVPERVH